MKKILLITLIILLSVNAETLFEVKDAFDRPVFSISDDGMRVINDGDTMMVISAAEARINLDNSKDRALSRSFSVSTNTTGKAGLANVLEVTTSDLTLRGGATGDQYTNFSPDNIFIGLKSGINTSGVNNVFVGNLAGLSNSTGFRNIFVGPEAGNANLGGDENVFVGYKAGNLNSSGNRNVFIGNEAGMSNISGFQNICIGDAAGRKSTAALGVFIGTSAGIANTTGSANMFVGNQAGANNTTGSFNMYLGWMAGVHSNGTNNTLLGTLSGWGNYTGDNNVYIGMYAGKDNNGGSNNVFVGYDTSVYGSNKLAIDNSDTATPLIYGDFSSNALTVNGTLLVTGNTGVGGTLTTASNATINGQTNIINSANVAGSKGLVIDTDGESSDIPLRIRTNGTPGSWTDADTKFVVWGDGLVESKSIKVNSGTELNMVQAGTYSAGTNSVGGVKTVTVYYPTAFTSTPKVNVTVKGGNYTDTFAITTRNVTTTYFQVNIYRVDSAGGIWGQTLSLDWMAWQQ